MLLRLTTIVIVALAWAPVAQAWSWPVQGQVLQPFVYDEAHPYAAGQHRGIDIAAAATGGPVIAPASGTVSFAGSVPSSGTCLTIETPGGYSVTLTHLGSIAVAEGASVDEGAVVGTVGPSGTPEQSAPYVHLGIRLSSDPLAYLDPAGLLPAPVTGGPSASTVMPRPAAKPVPGSGAAFVIRAAVTPKPAAVPAAPAATSTPTARRKRAPQPQARPETVAPPFALRRELADTAPGFAPAVHPHLGTPLPAAVSVVLGAGPGVFATLTAFAVGLGRRRRRRRPVLDVVVAFPQTPPLRRAA